MSEVEEREAAAAGHYSWKQWGELDREERIKEIAFHRVHQLIASHSDDAVSAEARRRSK